VTGSIGASAEVVNESLCEEFVAEPTENRRCRCDEVVKQPVNPEMSQRPSHQSLNANSNNSTQDDAGWEGWLAPAREPFPRAVESTQS